LPYPAHTIINSYITTASGGEMEVVDSGMVVVVVSKLWER
jgi:hypothetical protein